MTGTFQSMTISFPEVARIFEQRESGSDSFKFLFKSAVDLIKSDSEHAVFYFTIYAAAHNYVQSYEDQGVAPEFSEMAKRALVGLNSKVVLALSSSPEIALKLLNEVAYEYQINIHDF